MTKQEEIREGISNLIDNNYNARNPSYPELIAFQPMKFLNELLPYLHSQGVVIKVDRELPDRICLKNDECGYKHNCSHAIFHKDSFELCRHYSWNPCSCPKDLVAVEPLI